MALTEKANRPKGTPEQRYNTLTEVFIGRLMVLYKQNPERAADFLDKALTMMGIIQGDPDVRKTYTIDIKIDFDDDNRHKVMLHIARKAARQLLTQASLLADNRQPQVGITTDDFFEGGTKEALMDLKELGDGIIEDEPTNEAAS